MGQTVASVTSAGYTVANDGDTAPGSMSVGPVSVAFVTMGTGPALTSTTGGDGRLQLRVTTGTGTPVIAADNVRVTCGRTPRKVYLAASPSTPRFSIASLSGNLINISTAVAPIASTVYDLDLIVLY